MQNGRGIGYPFEREQGEDITYKNRAAVAHKDLCGGAVVRDKAEYGGQKEERYPKNIAVENDERKGGESERKGG